MGCALLLAALFPIWMGMGDRAAERTLTIHQLQSTETSPAQFQIDTSQLPSDAIDRRSDRGGEGAPVSSLELNSKYRLRVVLVADEEGK
jgi:hypothetical protein